MTYPSCRAIEADLIARAAGDADPGTARRVDTHVAGCARCRRELQSYRAADGAARTLLRAAPPASAVEASRAELTARLADVRRRWLWYRITPSSLGHILIARSVHGVAIVEYLGTGRTLAASRLARERHIELVEGGADLEPFQRELLDYLAGRRHELRWPVDLRLAGSEFRRAVLAATVHIPYGAVTSYAHLAREVGKPDAVRAVAQALRWNPVPIVVPCHRIIGASGRLTGYAGDKVRLKQHLLDVEGVHTHPAADDYRVAREAMYVRTGRGDSYCLPTCGDLPRRSLADLTLLASRAGAESLGLRPCEDCRPDLHPLVS